jgi:hypothetical protein
VVRCEGECVFAPVHRRTQLPQSTTPRTCCRSVPSFAALFGRPATSNRRHYAAGKLKSRSFIYVTSFIYVISFKSCLLHSAFVCRLLR